MALALRASSSWRSISFVLLILLCAVAAGCAHRAPTPVYQMGERAEVGPYVYSVLEAHWAGKLGDEPNPRLPRHRFLLIRISVTNGTPKDFSVPQMTLISQSNVEYPELAEGSGVRDWYGLFRRLGPSETVTRWILFDAPHSDYRLRVGDDAFDPADMRTALIEVPTRLAQKQ